MGVMKRRVILKKAAQIAGAAVIATGAVLTAAGASREPRNNLDHYREASDLLNGYEAKIRELEAQLADYQIQIEDLKDDRLAAPELLERERARIGELELALEQSHELRLQERLERRRYLREREAARRIAVKLMHGGDIVDIPSWADHPFYGGTGSGT